ncbi:hypothetical protein V8G54_036275 [Vigna mungo]|uniref:Uncharacterized protein n=1 Tax=Vigna mungo TaxID=3915 RepID=A0AAQ3RE96_VIGMU
MGISPFNLFHERSNHSNFVNLPNDSGMVPVILLCERLSPIRDFNSPMAFGISPSNILFDKSMSVKAVNILVSSLCDPFITITSESLYIGWLSKYIESVWLTFIIS